MASATVVYDFSPTLFYFFIMNSCSYRCPPFWIVFLVMLFIVFSTERLFDCIFEPCVSSGPETLAFGTLLAQPRRLRADDAALEARVAGR